MTEEVRKVLETAAAFLGGWNFEVGEQSAEAEAIPEEINAALAYAPEQQ